MVANRHDIPCLYRLATILVDAKRMYARAARIAGDADAVRSIERTMAERDELLHDVRDMIADLRGDEPVHGSLLGAAHLAFLDVRAMFERDADAALAEVQRGERYLRDEIRKAIRNTNLSADVRAFLGLALDRIVNGEIEGRHEAREQRTAERESIHPIPPHH